LCQRITRGLELFVGINLAMRGVDWKRSTAKHTNVLGALSVRAQCQHDLNHHGYYDAGVLLHTRCHTMHNPLPTLAF